MAQLIDTLRDSKSSEFCALVGFDGFVDEIVHVVDKRFDEHNFTRIPTIEEYGQRIINSKGLSTNFENIVVSRKLGGNGPLFALGLKKLGAKIRYIGAINADATDSLFGELTAESEVVGVCEPAHTSALEFQDGKLICSETESLNRLSWESIVSKVGMERFAAWMDASQLISFNNWTMIIHMNECWQHILDDILPIMKEAPNEKCLFFDLADPQKRSKEDVLLAVRIIEDFCRKGFNTVLGLNLKEANTIETAISNGKSGSSSLKDLTCYLGNAIGVDCVVVHPVECAACYTKAQYYEMPGPYCAQPKLTTGAGDCFNAGFMFGYVNNMPVKDCLHLGVMNSGYYVRNAKNADKEALIAFMEASQLY